MNIATRLRISVAGLVNGMLGTYEPDAQIARILGRSEGYQRTAPDVMKLCALYDRAWKWADPSAHPFVWSRYQTKCFQGDLVYRIAIQKPPDTRPPDNLFL